MSNASQRLSTGRHGTVSSIHLYTSSAGPVPSTHARGQQRMGRSQNRPFPRTRAQCEKKVGRAGGASVLIIMYGHSLEPIVPRIPIMLGRSTSGFYRPGRHRVHQARSAVRYSVSRVKRELHPAKNHSWGRLWHLVRTLLQTKDSSN